MEDKKTLESTFQIFAKKLSAVKNLLDVLTFSELNFYFAERLISNYSVLKSALLIGLGSIALLCHNYKVLSTFESEVRNLLSILEPHSMDSLGH